MADEIDMANEKAEKMLGHQLAFRKKSGPEPSGTCHNCGEEVEEGKRWCDAECRDMWERWTTRRS